MIELLLEAERAMSYGLVDQAERLYAQAAAADPRNSIAVVGLARVALERGNDAEAYEWARRALAIDPENVAAVRLVARLDEVLATRWMTAPMPAGPGPISGSVTAAAAPAPAAPARAAPAPALSAAAPEEQGTGESEPAGMSMPLTIPDVADATPEPPLEPQPEPPTMSPASATERPSAASHDRSLLDRLLRRNRP